MAAQISQLQTGLPLHRQVPSLSTKFCPCSLPTSAFQKRRVSLPSLIQTPLVVQCTAGGLDRRQSLHDLPIFLGDDDSQLPRLVPSMAIRGLPPRFQSPFHDEVDERMKRIAGRWKIKSFEFYARLAISGASFLHSGAVSADRLAALSIQVSLMFILDDLFFDTPNDDLLEEYGIDRSIRQSPAGIGEFLDHLNGLFSQRKPPHNPIPIEQIFWELGQEFRRLSNPEWFNYFADAVIEHHRMSVASHADMAGDRKYWQDLESYTEMRVGNFGGVQTYMLMEFANDAFLPNELRDHPLIKPITDAAIIHASFVNDIFSYHKEMKEGNPRNVIKVLMDTEGIPLAQAAWRAVDIVNSYTDEVTELEKQLPVWKPEYLDYAVRRYLVGAKEVMSGNLHWSSSHRRYRQSDSVFPELRIMSNPHQQLQKVLYKG